jgi:hypothetical protein
MLESDLHDLMEWPIEAVAFGPQHLEMKVLLPEPVTPITAMKTSVGLYNWSETVIGMAMGMLSALHTWVLDHRASSATREQDWSHAFSVKSAFCLIRT